MKGFGFSDPPPGFERFQARNGGGYSSRFELLLPGHVKDELITADQQRKQDEEKAVCCSNCLSWVGTAIQLLCSMSSTKVSAR